MAWPEYLVDFWFRLTDYMQAGGLVMWPLCSLSLIMWLLIFERLVFIGRLYRNPMSFKEAKACLEMNRMVTANGGVVARLVADFLSRRGGNPSLDVRIVRETVRSLNRSLEDRLAIIGVLAAVAPLLGLLGTVIGMITTFDVLAIFGTGNAKAMAGGISAALITTQTGLLVAIPGLYMKNFLERRTRNLAKRLTRAGLYLQRQLELQVTPGMVTLPEEQ